MNELASRLASNVAHDPAIIARGLTKVFHDPRRGDVLAAHDISFDCHSGEIFGLLGPNGAGKSTTLRMLATVLTPTKGTAIVAGADVVSDPISVRRAIGYLSTSTGLYARLTARETLEYFGKLHGLSGERLRSRVDELIALFGLEEFASMRCEKLSTGTKQKVSIARTIVHDPPVLILDEPTLGLDILVASTMLEFVERCREDGKCVIFSTHVMSEVERLCDRVGIIHRGSLRSIGTLDELRGETGLERLDEIFLRVIAEEHGPSAAERQT
ncbi:MAG TPA: ATP-binding cassette domain-containing protein [Planctomycetota bacterium]|nr:ATP-binding cassette domain-containing protein [Planctomycetota bacterium]